MTSDTINNKHRPAQVLLVEDNYGDILLTQRAFADAKISNDLHVAAWGEEAVEMLYKKGAWENSPTPDLILLDLNLPGMSGQDVLKLIKQDDLLKKIPVVILSSSKADQDVVKSYNLHANGYVVKPVSLENFSEVVQKLEQFWFSLVVLPCPSADESDM